MSINVEVTVIPQEIKRQMLHRGQVVLTYTIQYPQFESAVFRRAMPGINRFCADKAADFRHHCERELFRQAAESYDYATEQGYPFHPYEAMLVYVVTYNQNCALSVYFDQYEYTGGAHGMTIRSSRSWDLQTGRAYALRDFFPGACNYRRLVLNWINRQIRQQIADGTGQFFDNPEELAAQYLNEQSFYITPEGLVIYYQQYEIAPYSSGIQQFTIPFQRGGAAQPRCMPQRF